MLFRNPSFLPPVRKSNSERTATKTRSNQLREAARRECSACPRCAQHSLQRTMARLRGRDQRLSNKPLFSTLRVVRRLDRQRNAHEKSGYNNQSHIFKPLRAARVREPPSQCLPEKREGTYRLLRPCWSEFVVGLAERGQRREEEPPFGLDQFELDFLMSIPTRSNLHWVRRKLHRQMLYLVI